MARRKDAGERSPPSREARKATPGARPRAFDVWLDRGLHSMFDSVAQEPIPEDLLRLIEEDGKK